MGWKSTIDISRKEAIDLIQKYLLNATNDQLANAVESIGYGDDPDLEHYGHNFCVLSDDSEEMERKEYERLRRKFE